MNKLFLFFLICFSFKLYSQTTSKYIVVDQFGYRPNSEKIAVIRNPLSGFDAAETFIPSTNYALINVNTGVQVLTGSPTAYKEGLEDVSSGDQAWWFDFSAVETQGTYYILDIDKNLKSHDFLISNNVYEDVLKQAVRTFFFQRAGYEKLAQHTGTAWQDGASHVNTLQDTQARKFNAPNDSSTEKDLSGGWYDAGDYNKYTPWTSNYILDMVAAYKEKPTVWGDDYNLPYSGNSIPDIVDEIKWGLDHLLKLQEPNGAMISVVSLSESTPPSQATGQTLYGDVNTISALSAAAAFAHGAQLFKELGNVAYSNLLKNSAENAWQWAIANPRVIWQNNSAAYNSVGIGAGQQDTEDDYVRFALKMRAAIYLYELTNSTNYKDFVDNNYLSIHLMQWNFAFPFEQNNQETLLYYASLPTATPNVASSIKNTYLLAMNGTHNFAAFNNEADPYMAYLKDYTWGSNGIKSRKGLMFTDYINHNVNAANNDEALKAAERYIHYIHGVNPLNLCFLSNMSAYGSEHSVAEFYHTWFADGTDWDNINNDTFGPAPGFLVGGPNPSYDWDGCCPSGCSGFTCDSNQRDRLRNQPHQKSYDQFNTSWPMNSWEITENSNGYQTAYIRLLSKFVQTSGTLTVPTFNTSDDVLYFPNPFETTLTLRCKQPFNYTVFNLTGQQLSSGASNREGITKIGQNLKTGIYFVEIKADNYQETIKIIKQ
ncbi:glycoside hydrolase family 9 protein [Hyunsoonleella ulvae]|uniref:glycoside hydrolase family 9 protein n=1 Tax=Hyunsoonleella ulvae TaxID=2799948 RepID=UPI001939E60E|nr:glycoside hydrolase family 9 protein [Hyunsoonleella ulvae]